MTLLIHDLQDFPATNHEFRALGARGGYGRGTAALLRRGWAAGQGRRWTRVAAAVPALGVGRGRARRDADLPSVRVPSAQAPSPRALLRRFFCARPLSVPLPSLRLKTIEGVPIRFQARRKAGAGRWRETSDGGRLAREAPSARRREALAQKGTDARPFWHERHPMHEKGPKLRIDRPLRHSIRAFAGLRASVAAPAPPATFSTAPPLASPSPPHPPATTSPPESG